MYKKIGQNNKWNFIPKDMDFALAYTGNYSYKNNTFDHLLKQNNIISSLFKIIISDEVLKEKFKLKVKFLLNNQQMPWMPLRLIP